MGPMGSNFTAYGANLVHKPSKAPCTAAAVMLLKFYAVVNRWFYFLFEIQATEELCLK
jgi:hypothetical protein